MKKTTKSSSISDQPVKRKRGRPKIHHDHFYPGQEPSYKVMPTPKPDPEEDALTEEAVMSSKHSKYPPPKKDAEFRRRWFELIEGVTSRPNFKEGHLYQLSVLCDLYVEYESLAKFIRINGYTYEANGRQGKQLKAFPEVAQRNRVLSEIRSYSRMLGLLLKKDEDVGAKNEEEEWA